MRIPFHIMISSLSALFPFIAGLFVFEKLGKELKLIFAFFSIAVLFEITFAIMAIKQIPNIWLFHFYTLIEFSFWIFYFSSQFKKTRQYLWFKLTLLSFFVVWTAAKLLGENLVYLNDFTRPLESAILVIVGAIALFQLQKDFRHPLVKNPKFWINVGVLIYFSGNIFLFSLANVILTGYANVWSIHSMLNIFANCCYAGGLLCTRLHLKSGSWLSSALRL